MKFEFYPQTFEKYWNIKFHENPSSESWVVPCRQTDDMTLTDAFRNFANSPKKELRKSESHWTFVTFQLLHNLLRHHQLILCYTEYLPACSVVTNKRYSVYLSGRTYRLETIKGNNCFVDTRKVCAYNLYLPRSESRTLITKPFWV
jgi:hypothetical protein